MALSVRAASGGQNGSTTVASQAVTFPTGTTTNDLVYVIISVNAVATSPAATGWTCSVTSNATTTHSLIIAYRTIQLGDSAPTITWTGTAKASWTAVTLQPAPGQSAVHSGFGTAVNTGTAGTTHTPPAYAAGGLSGASVLLNVFRTGANGATGVTTTPPTNWTEPSNGDQTTAITAGARQVAAEVSVRTGQTGTITPGSETISVSSSGILQHAFAVEQALPPTTLTNSFDAGTDEATVTTGNSGTSGTAFDVVTVGTGATVVYDTARGAASSPASLRLATSGTVADAAVEWTTAMGTRNTIYGRFYLYVTANPGANHRLFTTTTSGAAALCAAIYLTTAGKMLVTNSVGGTISTSTNSVNLNAWTRVEFMIFTSATVGQTELKLFTSPDSSTAAETNTSAATQNTSAGPAALFDFGSSFDSKANVGPLWLDEIGLSDTGYIGPAAITGVMPPITKVTTGAYVRSHYW